MSFPLWINDEEVRIRRAQFFFRSSLRENGFSLEIYTRKGRNLFHHKLIDQAQFFFNRFYAKINFEIYTRKGIHNARLGTRSFLSIDSTRKWILSWNLYEKRKESFPSRINWSSTISLSIDFTRKWILFRDLYEKRNTRCTFFPFDRINEERLESIEHNFSFFLDFPSSILRENGSSFEIYTRIGNTRCTFWEKRVHCSTRFRREKGRGGRRRRRRAAQLASRLAGELRGKMGQRAVASRGKIRVGRAPKNAFLPVPFHGLLSTRFSPLTTRFFVRL